MDKKINIKVSVIFLCFLYVMGNMEDAFDASMDFISNNDLTDKNPKEVCNMIYDYVSSFK